MMTGDPNQQSRPTIFGEDYNYPAAPNPEWNRFTGNNFYMQSNFPFCSNYGPAPVTFPIHTNNKNGNCFGPIYNYQANSTNVFTPSVNTPSYSNSNFFQFSTSSNERLKFKRKTDSPIPVASKQHITEEKMAEHMSNLHISSETPGRHESDSELSRRLYMCEEMKKLQTDSILPAALLNRIKRPCTALVLWQPPQRLVPPIQVQNNTENDNNNEEEVPDQNLMDLV